MPNTEHDPIDRGFEWRLKAALDRVTPPSSNPRYASTVMGAARVWPLGPALVAAAATIVLLAVTATAATGSANPVVWAERAGSTMQSVGHTPEAAPSPEPSPETPHSAPAAPASGGSKGGIPDVHTGEQPRRWPRRQQPTSTRSFG